MERDALIYDCEISKMIPDFNRENDPQYRYCQGWHDHAGMGIACVCVYDFGDQMPRIFLRDNLDEFADLVARREYIIGFNSKSFDDKLCLANGIEIATTYDLYCEAKIACGHKANARVRGYSLDSLSQCNLSVGKSGDGALAPQQWQDKKPGSVISYCMQDVFLTKMLLEKGLGEFLTDPLTNRKYSLRSLFDGKHDGPQARLPL